MSAVAAELRILVAFIDYNPTVSGGGRVAAQFRGRYRYLKDQLRVYRLWKKKEKKNEKPTS